MLTILLFRISDGLDYQTDIPQEKIVNVHGSINKVTCEFCQEPFDTAEFKKVVQASIRNIYDPSDPHSPQTSSPIMCPCCSKPGLKPSTVMYGRDLPKDYFAAVGKDFPEEIDLLVIIGTSLTVFPACELITQVSESTPRVLCNRDLVGEHLGFSPNEEPTSRDIWLTGTCDESLLQFAAKLGWLDDLAIYKDRMCEQSRDTFEAFTVSAESAARKDDENDAKGGANSAEQICSVDDKLDSGKKQKTRHDE